MALSALTGQASNISLGSDYSYAASAQYGPVAIKNQLVSMRLDGRPVLFRTRTLPSISDGDRVSAAGKEKNGTLEAVVVRNLTTGALYRPGGTTTAAVLSVALIVLGVPLIAFLGIGLFFVVMGGWMLYKLSIVRKATKMLEA